MCHQTVLDLDSRKIKIDYFNSETLFINIYFCFYFSRYLSPYYSWGDRAIKLLKRNMRRMWLKDLPNIDFFIRQIEKRNIELDPFNYYFKSEDYFTKLMAVKPIADILFPVVKKKEDKEN